MSTTIAGSGFPELSRLLADLRGEQNNLNTLTAQASSGLVAGTWSGLGGNASVALSLGPRVDALQTAQNNINAANGPLQVTQTAMQQIQSIASNLLAQMPNLNSLSADGVDTIAASARTDLQQLADLLDTQYGGVYVFAGQDSTNPPVPDPDQITTSGFFSQIAGQVADLTANGATATANATLGIAGSNLPGTSPFSTGLSRPAADLALPMVAIGDGQSISAGLFASANTSAVSSGSSTTGSYMRDLMRALATVGSLTSAQANDPNFAALVSDTQTSLTNAVTAMSTDVGVLGEQQSALTATQSNLSDTQTALSTQLSTVQDVDMASTLSNLTQVETQLQASYQLIANVSTLTLTHFLPAP